MIETRNPARIAELPDLPPTNSDETPIEVVSTTNAQKRSWPRQMLAMVRPTRRKGTVLTLGLGVFAMGIAFHPLWLNQVKETFAAEPIDPPKMPTPKVEGNAGDKPLSTSDKPLSTSDKPVTVEPITSREFDLPVPIVGESNLKTVEMLELAPPELGETDKPGNPIAVPLLDIPSNPEPKPTEKPAPKVNDIPPLKFDDLPTFSDDAKGEESPTPAPLDSSTLTAEEPAPRVEQTTVTTMTREPVKIEETPKPESPKLLQVENEEPIVPSLPGIEPAAIPKETMQPIPMTTTETPPATIPPMSFSSVPETKPTPTPAPPVIEAVQPMTPPMAVVPAPVVDAEPTVQPLQELKAPFQEQPEPKEIDVAPQPEAKLERIAPQPEPAAEHVTPSQPEPQTNFDVDVHPVRPTDSYLSLSQLYYGSDRYADGLQAFNGNQRLQPGIEVKVPPMYVLRQRGGPAEETIQPVSASVSESRPTSRELEWNSAGANDRLQYVVPHSNMTLLDVAEDLYGNRNAWSKLFNANPQLDPNAFLESGTVLRLPEATRR